MNDSQQNQKSGESGRHQVLIAQSLVGGLNKALTHPNAKITTNYFHNAGRLKEYDLVVLPFSEFQDVDQRGRQSKDAYKDIFEKQLLEALEHGTTFCFIHHNETVPGSTRFHGTSGYESDEAADACAKTQAGFPWIAAKKIRIHRNREIILSADVRRGEFGTFLKKWGASYNFFDTFEDGKFDDVLYSINNFPLGFTIKRARGMMVYLPFQSNHSDLQDLQDGLLSLIDSLLTYKAKHVKELPEWAKVPLFENETRLDSERNELLRTIEAIEVQIAPYQEAKSLLVANEHDLEFAVPQFISTQLGMPTETEQKFLEDFWLLNGKKDKIAICEIKSVAKGFKKSAI